MLNTYEIYVNGSLYGREHVSALYDHTESRLKQILEHYRKWLPNKNVEVKLKQRIPKAGQS
jgi:hypothetical protein